MSLKSNRSRWLLAGCFVLALAACGGSKGGGDGSSGGGGNGGDGSTQTGRTFLIKPGQSETTDMIAAMVQTAPGDVI
ncbi:MAG: ABC transporter substrate-binding protein, partial [Nevskiales bacterium]